MELATANSLGLLIKITISRTQTRLASRCILSTIIQTKHILASFVSTSTQINTPYNQHFFIDFNHINASTILAAHLKYCIWQIKQVHLEHLLIMIRLAKTVALTSPQSSIQKSMSCSLLYRRTISNCNSPDQNNTTTGNQRKQQP